MNKDMRGCSYCPADNFDYSYPVYGNNALYEAEPVVYAPYGSYNSCGICSIPAQTSCNPCYEYKITPSCTPGCYCSPYECTPPQQYCCPPRPGGRVYAIWVVLFIVLLIGGGYFFYRSGWWPAGGRC
ncbi:hypothetical protein [Scopulibacillus cellulosilyticus]|uniref:Uncharacterized protein n=1 Tax=Scopulibacillus cellulosilyticus TaxID=2665665 RepID=A0ABW2Q008_9BACL